MKNLVLKIFSLRDLSRYTDQSWNLSKNKLFLSVTGKKIQKLCKASASLNGLFSVYLFETVFINENTAQLLV